jgi:hypothetical protein
MITKNYLYCVFVVTIMMYMFVLSYVRNLSQKCDSTRQELVNPSSLSELIDHARWESTGSP